jgi:ketosteroid isomerase-like protein
MNNHQSRLQSTPDQLAISDLIERWSKGVRDQDRAAIRQDHDADILMFDVPPPFQSRGIDEYMATWDTFFSFAEKPVRFDFTNIEITAGVEVAFATAVGHCVTIGRDGRREPLDFRLTMGLRKIDGRWHVMHEHHSLPAV